MFGILTLVTIFFIFRNKSAQPNKPTIQTPKRVKLLHFNINHGENEAGTYDLKQIIEIIKTQDPDFVTLADIDDKAVRTYRESQARKIAGNLSMIFTFGKTNKVEGGWTGNAILSKYPLIHAENQFLKTKNTKNQALLYAVFEAGEKNIHLFSTELSKISETAEKQTQEVVDKIVETMTQNAVNAPLFFTGSLNLPQNHLSIKGLKNYLGNATSDLAHSRRKTYPASDPEHQYDYIFFRKNSTLAKKEIINTQQTRRASDHLPVLAEFILK